MQSFYGQFQESTCYGQQAQTEEKRESNKEVNAPIEKKFRSSLKTRKGGKEKKSSGTFRKCRFPIMRIKRMSPAW